MTLVYFTGKPDRSIKPHNTWGPLSSRAEKTAKKKEEVESTEETFFSNQSDLGGCNKSSRRLFRKAGEQIRTKMKQVSE